MYEMEREIYCSQIGQGGIIRNSALVDLLQDASNLHLETHPVLADYFKNEDCVMFLVSRQVDIKRRPVYGERVRVKTWTYELNRMYGFRNTIIYGEDGVPCVECIAGGAFMNTKAQRPMRVPAELIDRVTVYQKHDMEYLPRKIALPDREPDRRAEVIIRSSDIDMNMHVNNARYFDIIDDLIPNSAELKRIRAEYKIPVKLTDKITAAVFEGEQSITAVLENEDGKQCFVFEGIK